MMIAITDDSMTLTGIATACCLNVIFINNKIYVYLTEKYSHHIPYYCNHHSLQKRTNMHRLMV